MACDRYNCIFHFGLFFALLPPTCPKNENFKNMKNAPGDIIILHKCTKNHDHMQSVSEIWQVKAGFELAVRNSQFAIRFGSLRMSFCNFCKNCESLKSDTL